MKLNNHEAGLLAKEIRDRLVKTASFEASPLLLAKIRAYKEKYQKLKEAEAKASRDLEKHEETWEGIVGCRNVYASDSMPRITQVLKEKSIPSVSDIKDKITLKGLFTNETDMEKFVESIVKEFAKKKPVTA